MPASKEGPAAERLRAFVRERVHKEGALYSRGSARKLAKAIGKPQSWVSHYVDYEPQRNADIDTALALCAFYSVELKDFAAGLPTRADTPTAPPARFARVLALLDAMSDAGQRRAFDVLVGLQRAYPRAVNPARKARGAGRTAGRGRRSGGTV